MTQNDETRFVVGDQVYVLIGRGGDEHIERAEVARVCSGGRLILRMIGHEGTCFMPVQEHYVLHICNQAGCENPTILREYYCEQCHYADSREAQAWFRNASDVDVFKAAMLCVTAKYMATPGVSA